VVPVRDAGKEDTLEVVEDLVERFAVVRRYGGEPARDVARFNQRQYRIRAGVLQVTFDPRAGPAQGGVHFRAGQVWTGHSGCER
jgi:hypothetical protein